MARPAEMILNAMNIPTNPIAPKSRNSTPNMLPLRIISIPDDTGIHIQLIINRTTTPPNTTPTQPNLAAEPKSLLGKTNRVPCPADSMMILRSFISMPCLESDLSNYCILLCRWTAKIIEVCIEGSGFNQKKDVRKIVNILKIPHTEPSIEISLDCVRYLRFTTA